MQLHNPTPYNAGLLATGLSQDEQMGCLIVRPTFRISEGELQLDAGDAWPVAAGPHETEWGVFPPDVPFLSGGVDVMLLGTAHAPQGSATFSWVVMHVGDSFRREVLVLGDRVWARHGHAGQTALLASDPAPFETMPLTYDRAYGGSAATEYGEVPFQANPEGRGFYLTADGAEGRPLPNLEHPERRISSVEDQPEPWCPAPYPLGGSLRALNAAVLAEDGTGMIGIEPSTFNLAHPEFIIPAAEAPGPGAEVRVEGVRPEGTLRFLIPPLGFSAEVALEERRYAFPLHLDRIVVLSDAMKVVLSYRVVFKYRIRPRERRTVTLLAGGEDSSP